MFVDAIFVREPGLLKESFSESVNKHQDQVLMMKRGEMRRNYNKDYNLSLDKARDQDR